MARDFQVFTILCTVGGSAAAPRLHTLSMPARTVVGIEFMIPSGNRGAVKFRLGMAGTPFIPSNDGGYLSGDAETIRWDTSGFPDSGAWQLFEYNDGGFQHLLQVRFICDIPQHGQSTSFLQPLSLAGLSG